jgi:hypothetical protein
LKVAESEGIRQKIIVGVVIGVTLAVVGGIVTVVTARLTDDKPAEPEQVASLTAFGANMDRARSGPGVAVFTFNVTNDGTAAARNCVAHLDDQHGRLEQNGQQPSLPAGATQQFLVAATRGAGASLYPFVDLWVSCGTVSSPKIRAVVIPA